MNILMCDTQYAFLQYFLLKNFDEFRDTFFVFDACFSPSIVENLEKAGMACHQQLYYDIPVVERPAAVYKNQDLLEKIIKGFYEYYHGDICIYGQDHIGVAQILWRDSLRDIPFILLEDGIGNYAKKTVLSRHSGYMEQDEYLMGHNSRVNGIILTGIWRIPNDIKNKVSIIDLKGLWNSKSDEEKQFFLNLYYIDSATMDILSRKKICYLGQSFSNFGMISLEKELSAYRKILSNYDAKDLYIKAHPTGFNINYKQEFPGFYVLMNPIPFEVVYFIAGFNLEIIASICSTAAMNVDENVEQHFYDLDGNRIKLVYPWKDLI